MNARLMGAAAIAVVALTGCHGREEREQKRECTVLLDGEWYEAPQQYTFTLTGTHEIWVYKHGVCVVSDD